LAGWDASIGVAEVHSAAPGRNHILVEQEEAEKAEFLVNE
jgi:hypothetical protein